MSHQDSSAATQGTTPDIEAIIQREEADWFLQDLVNTANASNHEKGLGITLNAQGILISGYLTSASNFFKYWSGVFQHEESKQHLEELSENIRSQHQNPENKQPALYIHLRDARFIMPGAHAIPNNQGVFWRGRLSEISGFNLGTFDTPDEAQQ